MMRINLTLLERCAGRLIHGGAVYFLNEWWAAATKQHIFFDPRDTVTGNTLCMRRTGGVVIMAWDCPLKTARNRLDH